MSIKSPDFKTIALNVDLLYRAWSCAVSTMMMAASRWRRQRIGIHGTFCKIIKKTLVRWYAFGTIEPISSLMIKIAQILTNKTEHLPSGILLVVKFLDNLPGKLCAIFLSKTQGDQFTYSIEFTNDHINRGYSMRNSL